MKKKPIVLKIPGAVLLTVEINGPLLYEET